MDYRLTDKNKNYNLQKILFMFAVFLVLFFLNTSTVFAGRGGESGELVDSETKPDNAFANGIKNAAWVPISACVRTIS